VQVFGLDAFRSTVGHGIALAERAESLLRARRGWEVVTPAQLSDRLLHARRRGRFPRLGRDGAGRYAAPSTTVLRGQTVLRLSTTNPRTTFEEIEETIERMERVV
jgi:aromatic-L-amino-acid decarboxylase